MTDGRDRTASEAGGSGNKVRRWRNPEIEKALDGLAADRTEKDGKEAGKDAAKNGQETEKETARRRHGGPNPAAGETLQKMAKDAARDTAEQNQSEPEDRHAAWEASVSTAPAVDTLEVQGELEDHDAQESVCQEGQHEDVKAARTVEGQMNRAYVGAKSQKQQDERNGEPFHKNSQKKNTDKKRPKELFSRFRSLAVRVYQSVKRIVGQIIGRGRIPTMPMVNKTGFSRTAMDLSSKDKPSVDKATQEKINDKEKGRNWGDLFYHGAARRLLGKDAYMYAVQQSEKQDASRQGKNAQEPEKPGQAQKDGNGKGSEKTAGREETHASQEKPEHFGSTETQKQGSRDRGEPSQKGKEVMKGKFNSLHKIITDDLEDRFSNAKEAKEAYLRYYAEQLQEKLTEINHGEPVRVSAERENGKLEIRINDEPEQYGGYPSFMGCSRIRVAIDRHLNITSAEAFVPTKQTDDGKFIGRKIDISDTLGVYIISDLARNFREDYNRGAESYNLASRNEFEKTMRDTAAQGHKEFMIDNITYSIAVKDHQIQVNQAAGDKAFSIAMDAGETEAAREKYEAKSEKLQEVEKKVEDARNSYKELVEKYGQKQEAYKQAEADAMAAKQKHRDATLELNKIQKQLSGRYPGAEKMEDLKTQEQKAIRDRNMAFKESKDANIEKNTVQAEMDKVDREMNQAREQIGVLEHEATSLRDACREAKEQYDSVSLAQKDVFREIYQAHTRNVVEGRASSIRVFEEILPGCRNDIGRNLGLEDLGGVMEETGRTSMEEALNSQVRDGQGTPSIDEGCTEGLESQEISAELE